MNTSFKCNLSFFITSCILILTVGFNNISVHAFHQNPVFFIILFIIIGLLISYILKEVNIFLPIKIFINNMVSVLLSFGIFYTFYDNCVGYGCKIDVYYFLYLIIYFFIMLKIYLPLFLLSFIYFFMKYIEL